MCPLGNKPRRKRQLQATVPGEGERWAQRGYVPQYDLAACIVYQALAAGTLRWIGVADRGAGAFDDIVLGFQDRIRAYQVKTSSSPGEFSIKTLLLGSSDLLGKIVGSFNKLSARDQGARIEVTFACDDTPFKNDDVGRGCSSDAYIKAHQAYGAAWTLEQWRRSPFADFVAEVQTRTGLDEASFQRLWSGVGFLVGGQGRQLGIQAVSDSDKVRIGGLAAELPRLVADEENRDRWPVDVLLARLGWCDPFKLRHSHAFPVDALWQANEPTQELLAKVLSTVTAGYVSLVGPPGCGKSTLLSAGLLPAKRALVLRYLAFVPNEGHGLGRAEAFDFLHDLVGQFKQQGLGGEIITGAELPELRQQLQAILLEAHRRFVAEGVRTIVVVDGLDHVPREERPQHSFLCEFPQPHALPDGVVFVLGTQRLDLSDIPPAVSAQAREGERCVVVAPLPRDAVCRIADAAGVAVEVDRGEIYGRTGGHPLSTRYVIEGLLIAPTDEERSRWLAEGPAYGGDVNAFYERAWRDLEGHEDARRALAYAALAEGPIAPGTLDRLVGERATDAAWAAAQHLLIRDHRNAWRIFHNSFRLFLRERTGLRHGLPDAIAVSRRYVELAEAVRSADLSDPQRWMELRYFARAENHGAVAGLAAPERFREQFIQGRNPDEIFRDMEFVFLAAGKLKRTKLVLETILAKHEIKMRSDALGDEVFDAFIALNDLDSAQAITRAASLSVGKAYQLVDALLLNGEHERARAFFQEIEPVDKLLGIEPLDMHRGDDDVFEWAERALIFRTPQQVMASISRLRAPEQHGFGATLEETIADLKMVVCRGQMRRHPELRPEPLMDAFLLERDVVDWLRFAAAVSAYNAGDASLVSSALEEVANVECVNSTVRLQGALICIRLRRDDLAQKFIAGLPAPTLAEVRESLDDEVRTRCVDITRHAAVTAALRQSSVRGSRPSSDLYASLQLRLENLGRLLGEAWAHAPSSIDPQAEFRALLDFLQHARDEREHTLWKIRRVADEVISTTVTVAAALGPETFSAFSAMFDARLASDGAKWLGSMAVRRAYACGAYKYEFNAERAESRIAFAWGGPRTPEEQIAEAAAVAKDLASFGLEHKARALLTEMHDYGLGYSRPPKKDPQYQAWDDLFRRACEVDPARAPDRIRFFGRLLSGMAQTEGDGAAYRLVRQFVKQASSVGPQWASLACDLVEEAGLSNWPELVHGVLLGTVAREPELVSAASIIFGRIALPFSGKAGKTIFPELVRQAPEQQLPSLARHAMLCIEADSHVEKRIEFLIELDQALLEKGRPDCAEPLARWRAELQPPASGNSPEDPFWFLQSLDEFMVAMRDAGEGWGAPRAFARIASKSDYPAIKDIFARVEKLQEDDDCILAMAKAAIAAGHPEDADGYLLRLKALAEDKGGWGDGWSGTAKLLYHQLDVLLRGEGARQYAFDCFIDDLANGKVSSYLLPYLDDVLSLLSPQISGEEAWNCLERHLSNFREYSLGGDLGEPPEMPPEGTECLADLLFRAFGMTAFWLTHMARVAAMELLQVPKGAEVVEALLRRLFNSEMSPEAARIAWEGKNSPDLQGTIINLLPEMFRSRDLGIREVALMLASELGTEPVWEEAALPGFYDIELPPHPLMGNFSPPPGWCATSSGLYTDDYLSWTWPLKDALSLTARATGLAADKLRYRVGQVMARMGGSGAFGPPAIDRQLGRLKNLELQIGYSKLSAVVAFAAMREVACELAAAGRLEQDAASFILHESGHFSLVLKTFTPAPRPIGVPAPDIPEFYRTTERDAWIETNPGDLVAPRLDGFVVLGSTAIHERKRTDSSLSIQSYFGPNSEEKPQTLHQQLNKLPKIIFLDRLTPLYNEPAQGAIVRPIQPILEVRPPHLITFCPWVAQELGWRPSPDIPMSYIDLRGNIVCQTIYWRDGGIRSNLYDSGVFRSGFVVVIKECVAPHLSEYLVDRKSLEWRTNIDTE